MEAAHPLLDLLRENGVSKTFSQLRELNVKITQKGDLACFKYRDNAPRGHHLVNFCRGIIIDTRFLEIVCYPFDRFYNYGEKREGRLLHPNIDSNCLTAVLKHDGTLIKVYFYRGQWHVATVSTISAHDAPLTRPHKTLRTFADLWEYTVNTVKLDYNKLDRDCTYMFELVGPYNKVLVDYKYPAVYHIGTRCVRDANFREIDVDIGVPKPEPLDTSKLNTLAKIQDHLAGVSGFKCEGFVVTDGQTRVKVKAPDWIALHNQIYTNWSDAGNILVLACRALVGEYEPDSDLSKNELAEICSVMKPSEKEQLERYIDGARIYLKELTEKINEYLERIQAARATELAQFKKELNELISQDCLGRSARGLINRAVTPSGASVDQRKVLLTMRDMCTVSDTFIKKRVLAIFNEI